MLNLANFVEERQTKPRLVRLPFHCGPIQAAILAERSQAPRPENRLIYQPQLINLLNG